MKKVILSIEGMSCSACSSNLEKFLSKQKGIIKVNANLVLANLSVEYEDITIEDINKYIKEAGFKSLGIYNENKERKEKKTTLIIFTILTILVLYISMAPMLNLKNILYLDINKYPINYVVTLLLLTITYLIYGFDILKNGLKNLLHKMPNMDSLVTIGVLSSFIYSIVNTILLLQNYNVHLYYESVCTVIYFVKLGRFIDIKNKNKTKEAIKDLVTITPSYALLKNGQKISIEEIKKGDILLCKEGMKIAVDGIITKGNSHISESFITGESYPKKKKENDLVLAGSLNIDGLIEYKALKIGKDSTISSMVRLVIDATNTKMPINKLVDKVSNIFVPLIILISIITFIFSILFTKNIDVSLTRFVSVLVISCPCALGLATPLALIIVEGRCAKKGILVKTGEVLENACQINTVVFDKTGTLTYGNLNISKIYNYSNYDEIELMHIISSIENKSNHPIAKAFKTTLELYEVTNYENIIGIGLKGIINNKTYYIGSNKILKKLNINNLYEKEEKKLQELGNSIIYVIENNKIISLIGVKDIVKKDAKKVIKELKKLNKKVIMLTGDNELSAKVIANELNINTVFSNVLPNDKNKIIKDLLKENKVMMIGDGINDSSSLVLATIGLSFYNATDIASNSSDVILMNDNLLNIINLINISQKTIKNIKQNLFLAFIYNICMIPFAMGIIPNLNINPILASICMMISSLTVVFNALRLRRI